jgi:TM2 domain-containing membrane protein YozV
MRFGKTKERAITDLEPLVEPSPETLQGVAVSQKLSERVDQLKALREGLGEEARQDRTIRLGDQKSAASLSLLFPGLGQIYMKQRAIGSAFALSNIVLVLIYLFFGGIFSPSFFDQKLISSYDFRLFLIIPLAIAVLSGISIHMAFGLFPELKLAQLITANRKNKLYWLNLIFPGYGQLLNGQPKKGVFFSSMGVLGLFYMISIFFTYSMNWYEYLEQYGIQYLERGLLFMSMVFVLSLLTYIVSNFDAYVVRRYPYLKRPVINRLKRFLGIRRSPNDRTVYRRTSLKFVLASMILVFFVCLFILSTPYRYFYEEKLETISRTLKDKGMKLVPALIDRIELPEGLEMTTGKAS